MQPFSAKKVDPVTVRLYYLGLLRARMTDMNLKNMSYLNRIQSIDLLRGIVLIVMALDHVRDFFGPTLFNALDLTQTMPTLFFTRWITHFCAPVFVFLTGISAYLYGKNKTKRELSGFLFKRGLWLIFLELTVVTFAWKFALDSYVFLGVIWALGASMVILSALIWLPILTIFLLSLVIVFGSNSLDYVTFPFSSSFLGVATSYIYSKPTITSNYAIIYTVLPWAGVMSFGYCLGTWFQLPTEVRNKRFLLLGCACLTLFIGLRYYNFYGDPVLWQTQTRGAFYTFLSFINVTKYPVSLLYLLLMLGITFLCWPIYENWRGFSSKFILTFGKVSLFFYLIHLFIIHTSASLYSIYILEYPAGWWWGITPQSSLPWPSHYQFNLIVVYAAWALIILASYPLCLLYKKYKASHHYRWLSYL